MPNADECGKMYISYFLFIARDVFMEKHWKSVVPRSVCDYFFDAQRKATSPDDIPPVIATPHHYLISIYRCSLFFVAVSLTESEMGRNVFIFIWNEKWSEINMFLLGSYMTSAEFYDNNW